jgi:hypothetical protein
LHAARVVTVASGDLAITSELSLVTRVLLRISGSDMLLLVASMAFDVVPSQVLFKMRIREQPY